MGLTEYLEATEVIDPNQMESIMAAITMYDRTGDDCVTAHDLREKYGADTSSTDERLAVLENLLSQRRRRRRRRGST